MRRGREGVRVRSGGGGREGEEECLTTNSGPDSTSPAMLVSQ